MCIFKLLRVRDERKYGDGCMTLLPLNCPVELGEPHM